MGLWDKLEDYANAAAHPVVHISPEYKDAFYNHEPWTYTDPEGKDIKVGAGAVAYGFKDNVPGIVAHELGHAKAWDNYPDLGKKLVMLSRLGANGRQLYKRLGVMLPAAGALASLYTKNPLWLAGASAAGLTAAAPMLYDEYRANKEGEKIVNELGGSKEDRDIVSGGFMSHALGATALPAVGLLGGLLGKAWMDKKGSFADVKAIYDSLPDEQKKLVAPRGKFVDSPRLKLREVTPEKDGFAEAYSMPGDEAFVTLAVSPKAQGKGKGTELLQQIIARARAEKVKKLVYRLHASNDPSRAIVHKFVESPTSKGEDWEEYTIDPSNVRDPYGADLPSGIEKAMEEVKDRYKTMGYDLSDVGLKGSLRSRYENGAVVPFSVLPKKLQVGASWVPTDNSVYFHPDLEAAMKLYGVKGAKDAFARTLAAHELAHAIDQRYADDALRKKVLQQAKDSGFTTPYLDALPFEQNRDKEIFAEYLANKALRGAE